MSKTANVTRSLEIRDVIFTEQEAASDEEWIISGTPKELEQGERKPIRGVFDFSWSILVLTVSGGLSGVGIYVKVTLAGITIASAVLSASEPQFDVSANVGAAKTKFAIIADFDSHQLWVSGQLQTRKWFVGGWNNPHSFKECILSW